MVLIFKTIASSDCPSASDNAPVFFYSLNNGLLIVLGYHYILLLVVCVPVRGLGDVTELKMIVLPTNRKAVEKGLGIGMYKIVLWMRYPNTFLIYNTDTFIWHWNEICQLTHVMFGSYSIQPLIICKSK